MGNRRPGYRPMVIVLLILEPGEEEEVICFTGGGPAAKYIQKKYKGPITEDPEWATLGNADIGFFLSTYINEMSDMFDCLHLRTGDTKMRIYRRIRVRNIDIDNEELGI